jgi:LacI family transcriptional regulator
LTAKATTPRLPSTQAAKHRIADIAALAGVGVATVDRVLNERGNVSEKTARKVLDVARSLRLKRVLPSSHHRMLRIDVLLGRPDLPLIGRIGAEFARLAERIDRSVVIQRSILKSDAPQVYAQHIASTKCDAVVMYASDHPLIRQAIADAKARGVETITIFSDLPASQRLAYCGTDPVTAGRTAGLFMARMMKKPGPVIALCGDLVVHGHAGRVQGLRDALREYAPRCGEVQVLQGDDDSTKSERLLLKAFRAKPDLAGFYNAGAANPACGVALTAGVLKGKPVFIGHELTHETRPMLQSGVMALAIDQYPEHQARFAVDVLLHHFGFSDAGAMATPYRSNISFQLYSRENIAAPGGSLGT